MNKHEKMYQDIEKHGNNLKRIFNLDEDPIKLCKKLHSLERKAHLLATQYCNGDITIEGWEEKTKPILETIKKILNTTENFPIFINGDAHGYALKIKDDYMTKCQHINGYNRLYRDWGGYGILAPNFKE